MGLFKSDKSDRKSFDDTPASAKLPAGTGPGTSGIPAAGSNTPSSTGNVSPSQSLSGNTNNLTARSASQADASAGGLTSAPTQSVQPSSNTAGNAAGNRSVGAAAGSQLIGNTAGSQSIGNTAGSQSISNTAGNQSVGSHSVGHGIKDAVIPDVESASHDSRHLQQVTQEQVRHVEKEEVLVKEDRLRNVHHVQHHVQRIVDEDVKPEIHHENIVPVTSVAENHDSTTEDQLKYNSLNTVQNTQTHLPTERTVIDLGTEVNEKVAHHVHHVIQPVIELNTIDQHRIHTVIPKQVVTHEAPIVHRSTTHEPISKADFLAMGGVLNSGITHENAGVLAEGTCSREVSGVGEQLAKDLHLGSTSTRSNTVGGSVGSPVAAGSVGSAAAASPTRSTQQAQPAAI